jgi:hypothetical protein
MCIATFAQAATSVVPDVIGGSSGSDSGMGGALGSMMDTGMSMLGQQQQANSTQQQAQYMAALANNQQIIAEENAQAALNQGIVAEQNQRLLNAGAIGTQRARLAANGVDLGSGSALDVQSDTAEMGELSSLSLRNQAEQRAYPYQVQAQNAAYNADLATFNANQYSPFQGFLGGGGGSSPTLL